MKTVLIVDDLPLMRTIMKNIISQLPFPCECIEAGDGMEALQYLSSLKMDLIFVDWKMPNLSGLDFVKRVRALKIKVPVIMVTGEAGSSSVKEALRAGITDYIVKPVTREVLKEKLSKLNILDKSK